MMAVRSGSGPRSWLRTTAIALAVLVVAGVAVTTILVGVYDLRVELAGSGSRPIFSFGDRTQHYDELEADRARHRAAPVPAGTSADAALNDEQSRPYWTDFRGPARDGRYLQGPVDLDWPAGGLTPIWRQPIGGGYASFAVADGRAFTIEQRRDQEMVAAYDVATGRELWTHAWDARFDEPMGGPGPRATPTWNRGQLFALGATGQLWCLDAATGEVIWHRDILGDSEASNLEWAMAGSPLVVDDVVVVQPGGRPGWSVVAYDRDTGEVAWHTLDDVQSYTSPMLMTLAGERQIVVVTGERIVGLTLDGRAMWEHPWEVDTVPNIAQPLLVGPDRLFLSASYGRGASVIELVSPEPPFRVETVWQNNRMKNKFSSSVLHEGYVYGLDESILACVDARTGELQWKGGRYGYGQLIFADDHLIVLTEDGDLVLVRATPEGHEEVARSPALEGKTWNVPALADGRLLVRNAREMAAFDLQLP